MPCPRYRPQDWDHQQCRKELDQMKNSSDAQKLKALEEIYQNCKPVVGLVTRIHETCPTGELINIDFGIAFERGKHLGMPEMVPFRLTRDIVAGLGCLGTCGLFRRCAETAMALLRQNAPLVTAAGALSRRTWSFARHVRRDLQNR
eukprot:Skav216285  [mRNA]  locus=scaffold4425:9508:11667:- [translate_table: standard]